MKSTSISGRNIVAFIRKLIPIREHIKTIALVDFLFCLFAGVLSQGELFGTLKPFGLAFYAAYSGGIAGKILMAFSITVGNIISGDILNALKQAAVLFLYEWIKKVTIKDDELIKNSLAIGVANGITGFFIFLVSGQIAETVFFVIMEMVLVSVVATVFSITLNYDSSKKVPAQKNIEYMGLLLMGGAFLLGISGIRFKNVSLDRIMAGAGILMLTQHFGPGFGACAGIIAGISLSAAYPNSFPSLIGAYAVSGFIAGILQKSKIASGVCYFVVQAIFLYTVSEIHLTWLDIIIPVTLFWLLPDLKVGKLLVIRNFVQGESIETKNMDRVRKTMSKRLEGMSMALYKLGYSVEKQLRRRLEDRGEVCGAVMEQLSQQVCSLCAKSSTCWEKKLFFTYKTFCDLIDSLQKPGINPGYEPEQELSRFCVKSGLVIDTLMRIIEIKRIDRVWQKAVLETRRIIPEQIFCISEILSKISGEMLKDVEYFNEEEKNILSLLKKKSFPVYGVEVVRGENGKFMVNINMEECRGSTNCMKEIESIVTKVLGTQMLVDEGCCKNTGGRECLLNLTEKENLGILTGVARRKKDKARVSGDSFTFLKIRPGKYIVAISDGMGSGREANRLSETAIGLFEQLLDCGLSIRLALSLVNIMIEVSNPEKYATMDISVIDLYTGETEFYKMGAMPSLIVKGRDMDYVQVNNLPAGLHQENPISFEKRKISDGEFIIMMTDGAYDRLCGGNEKDLLENVISIKTTLNPQELAEHLLKNACGNIDNISDDMTVLVAKLWRKAG